MDKGIHVPVHFWLHVIVERKDAALFQHPQGLQQQSLLVRTHYIVVDIVAHHGVETLIREIQLVGIPVPERTPEADALALGIFLAHGLTIAVGHTPIVHAGDLGVRPGESRPYAQCAGAASNLQKLSLPVKIQMGEDDLMDPLHHSSAAESVLLPYPCTPDQQGKQRRCGNREQDAERGNMKHGKG